MSVSSPPVAAKFSKANVLQKLVDAATARPEDLQAGTIGQLRSGPDAARYELVGAVLQDVLPENLVEGGPYRLYTKHSKVLIEHVPSGRVWEGWATMLLGFALRAGVADAV